MSWKEKFEKKWSFGIVRSKNDTFHFGFMISRLDERISLPIKEMILFTWFFWKWSWGFEIVRSTYGVWEEV